ncbi:unnamed protein product [Amoebophrya sp. A25]|nr:unnamed protein product [Amoebophrya sp. A25]|eukprot:GSA25T00021915001.1
MDENCRGSRKMKAPSHPRHRAMTSFRGLLLAGVGVSATEPTLPEASAENNYGHGNGHQGGMMRIPIVPSSTSTKMTHDALEGTTHDLTASTTSTRRTLLGGQDIVERNRPLIEGGPLVFRGEHLFPMFASDSRDPHESESSKKRMTSRSITASSPTTDTTDLMLYTNPSSSKNNSSSLRHMTSAYQRALQGSSEGRSAIKGSISAVSARSWALRNNEVMEFGWRISELQFFEDAACSKRLTPMKQIAGPTDADYAAEASRLPGRLSRPNPPDCPGWRPEREGANKAYDGMENTFWMSRCCPCKKWEAYIGADFGKPVILRCVLLWQSSQREYAAAEIAVSKEQSLADPLTGSLWTVVASFSNVPIWHYMGFTGIEAGQVTLEFAEEKGMHCFENMYGPIYDSLSDALAACNVDGNCAGIYNPNCERLKIYLHIPKAVDYDFVSRSLQVFTREAEFGAVVYTGAMRQMVQQVELVTGVIVTQSNSAPAGARLDFVHQYKSVASSSSLSGSSSTGTGAGSATASGTSSTGSTGSSSTLSFMARPAPASDPDGLFHNRVPETATAVGGVIPDISTLTFPLTLEFSVTPGYSDVRLCLRDFGFGTSTEGSCLLVKRGALTSYVQLGNFRVSKAYMQEYKLSVDPTDTSPLISYVGREDDPAVCAEKALVRNSNVFEFVIKEQGLTATQNCVVYNVPAFRPPIGLMATDGVSTIIDTYYLRNQSFPTTTPAPRLFLTASARRRSSRGSSILTGEAFLYVFMMSLGVYAAIL